MSESESKTPTPTNPYPTWAPRFWHGMRASFWWRVLLRNKIRLSLPKVHIAVGVSLITPCNELLALKQWLLFGRQIARAELEHDPIFILGHWRSGTTLLHELLVTNPNWASPNTYQCFAPSHFLVSEIPMTTFGGFLLPKNRPMDNMEAGWKLPQEDEFALMNLGIPTPYLRIAFPKSEQERLQYLNFEGVAAEDVEKWKSGFLWFLRVLTYHYGGKQLILKSPTHTGRLGLLAEMFPRAKFIHLSRDPVKLYSSSMRLWKSLEEVQSLQQSQPEAEMERYVLECHQRMYEGYHKHAPNFSENQLAQISYEQLASNPLETVRELYKQLDLGDFSQAEEALQTRLENHRAYRPNVHQTDAATIKRVAQHWPEYCQKYGYEDYLQTLESSIQDPS